MNASVVIDKYNVTYLNGREIPAVSLGEALEKILGENPAGRRTVMFKVHHEVTAVYFEPVIEAISEAGGELHHILKEEKKRQ
jgi:biopolymer transport protein ExbD